MDPATQPPGEVRFGATVTLRTVQGGIGFERTFTIVGVDEADIAQGKVGFVAPIARAAQGAQLGQTITLRLGPATEKAEVVAITY